VIVQVPGQAEFKAQVGTSFELVAGSERFRMRLASCEGRGSDERFEQFSLLFTAPAGAPLQQGSYEVEHPALGNLPLFLVPIAGGADGVTYEAVFSRLRTEARE
jgi:hypothetical protein